LSIAATIFHGASKREKAALGFAAFWICC